MDHIKKEVSHLVDQYSKEDTNEFKHLIPAIMKIGLDKADISMFDEPTKNRLLVAIGDEYLKRGSTVEAFNLFKQLKNDKKLVEVGDEQFKLGLFGQAVDSYILANDQEKLRSTGEFLLKNGHLNEVIKAFLALKDQKRLKEVGEFCLDKEKYPQAIEIFRALNDKEKLKEIGNLCMEDNQQLDLALIAFEIISDEDCLNKIADRFLKIGSLSKAIRAYKLSGNKSMIDFIKQNFDESTIKRESSYI